MEIGIVSKLPKPDDTTEWFQVAYLDYIFTAITDPHKYKIRKIRKKTRSYSACLLIPEDQIFNMNSFSLEDLQKIREARDKILSNKEDG